MVLGTVSTHRQVEMSCIFAKEHPNGCKCTNHRSDRYTGYE